MYVLYDAYMHLSLNAMLAPLGDTGITLLLKYIEGIVGLCIYRESVDKEGGN